MTLKCNCKAVPYLDCSVLSSLTTEVGCADHVLGLALSVFRTDAVLLHLRDKDEMLAKSATPPVFKPGTCAAVCLLLEPPPADMCVLEDPSTDPR